MEPSTKKNRWKILLIDDDEEDWLLIREMLSGALDSRSALRWARNYETGWQALHQDLYDGVLVDYDLGAHTGIDLIRLATGEDYPGAFILYTGRGSRQVDLEAMQAGASMYLTKGETSALMLERGIRYAIERKQSETRFRSLFNGMAEGFALHDIVCDENDVPSDYRFLEINPAFESLTGLKRHDVLGKLKSQIPQLQNDDPRWITIYGQVALTGEPVHFENYSPALDRHYEVFAYRPAPGQFAVLFMDISERKRIESELKASEQRARQNAERDDAILNEMTEGLVVSDVQGNVLAINATARRLHGHSLQEDVEKPMDEIAPAFELYDLDGRIIPFEDWPMPRVLRGERFDSLEVQVRRLDRGETRILSYGGAPIRDHAGLVTYGIVTSRDITQQKQVEAEREQLLRQLDEQRRIAEELASAARRQADELLAQHHSLQQGQQRMVEILESINDGFFALDRDWRFTYINLKAAANVGRDPAELVGQNLWEAFPRLLGTPHEAGYRQAMEGRVPVNFEVDGVLTAATYDIRVYPSAEGISIYWIDITERKRMENELHLSKERLEQSNRALEDFALEASHDLQEPLRKVQMFGDQLARLAGPHLDETGRDYLRRMQAAAARMSAMVGGLMALSRVTSQGRPFQAVDLNHAARLVLDDLDARLVETQGEVRLETLPVVLADPLQVRQLLQNLIANALKFHRPGIPPVVRVSSCPLPGGRVEIFVADNGTGFDPRDAERIFEPFQRLAGHSTYDGNGMGLPLCRKIVVRHGGSISATSKPGEGSCFSFTLPLPPA